MMRRLLTGMLANAYGQGVTIAVQLLSVPGFLHAWGSERYGVWLILSALPAALSFADCGLTIASGTAMTAAIARGDRGEARRLFAQAARLVAAVAAIVAAAVTIIALLLPDWMIAVPATVAVDEVRMAALALLGATLAGLGLAVVDTAFRAGSDYAFGASAVATTRLVEGAGALAAASAGFGLAVAAGVLLSLRLVGLLGLVVTARSRQPWIRRPWPPFVQSDLRPLIGPALAALAVPAGLAANLQGLTVAAGLVLPVAAVPVWAATRTGTRVIVQAIGLFTHALMPEMARAAGRGDAVAVAAILRANRLVGAGTLLPAWAVLLVVGPTLMARWTGGRLDLDVRFFAIMATAALCHAVWLSHANLLLATNRQAEFAYRSVLVAVFTALAAIPLGRAAGLLGIAAASLGGECIMVALVLPRCLRHAGFVLATPLPQGEG